MDDQITRLQETLAHQDEEIRRLSDELYLQQKEMAQLRKQVADLQERVQAAVEESNIRSPDQETPPPHY